MRDAVIFLIREYLILCSNVEHINHDSSVPWVVLLIMIEMKWLRCGQKQPQGQQEQGQEGQPDSPVFDTEVMTSM